MLEDVLQKPNIIGRKYIYQKSDFWQGWNVADNKEKWMGEWIYASFSLLPYHFCSKRQIIAAVKEKIFFNAMIKHNWRIKWHRIQTSVAFISTLRY